MNTAAKICKNAVPNGTFVTRTELTLSRWISRCTNYAHLFSPLCLKKKTLPIYLLLRSECDDADKVKKGDYLSMHYTGTIDESSPAGVKGEKFDSSRDRGQTFDFTIG